MEKTKYRCPYISDTSKLCEMSVPCRECSQFSPDYLEKILTTTNNARDEILLCIDKDHCPHKLWKSSIGYYCGCKQRKTLPVTVARNRPRTILEA